MKKSSVLLERTHLRLCDPAMTCKDLALQQPRGKILEWTDKDVVVVKYPGYSGHCGGGVYEYVPSEIVVYQLEDCQSTMASDGFSETTVAVGRRLVSFNSRKK